MVQKHKKMSIIYNLYQQFMSNPDGHALFTKAVCQTAPYFSTIDPLVEEIRPGYSRVSMKKTKEVHNHIQTVHAIAMANLCELAMGMAIEASIPENKRWIPFNMNISYLKKAETDLTATCHLETPDWANIKDLPLNISVKDTNDVEVVTATITLRISDKKKK